MYSILPYSVIQCTLIVDYDISIFLKLLKDTHFSFCGLLSLILASVGPIFLLLLFPFWITYLTTIFLFNFVITIILICFIILLVINMEIQIVYNY
jgi:hypothetical protein